MRIFFRISDIPDDRVHLQQDNLDIYNCYTQLTSMWKQIDTYLLTLDCTWVLPCTCDVITNFRKFRIKTKFSKF